MKDRTRRWLAIILLGLGISNHVPALAGQARTTFPSTTLLSAVTTTQSSSPQKPATSRTSYQASGVTTAGAGAATVIIEVSNVEAPTTDGQWTTACTITLTLGTTRVSDGCGILLPWRNVRARLSAVSGTNAAVTVLMGVG